MSASGVKDKVGLVTFDSANANLVCFSVLHVDDDASFLSVSKRILELDGKFAVDVAVSVDEALKKVSVKSYDAIISDYDMPCMNGLEFFKVLRVRHNSLPFIIFTGKGREEVAIDALNLGADGYYTKYGSTETVFGELAYGIYSAIEKRQTKEALAESEKRYRTILDQAPEAVLIHNVNGQLVDVNAQACKSLGYTRKELLSMNIADVDGQVAIRNDKQFWSRAVAGECFTFDSYLKCKDQTLLPVEVSIGPIVIDKETLIVGFVRDNANRRLSEKLLRQSEVRYRSLYENSFDAILLSKPDGSILYANPAACKMFGMREDEIRMARRQGIVVADERLKAALKEREQTGKVTAELTFKRKDGSTFAGEVSSTLFSDVNGTVVTSLIIRDISGRKKTEVALQESEALYKELVNSLPEVIFETDMDGRITFANPQAYETTGYSKEDFASGIDSLDLVAPEDRERVQSGMTRIRSGFSEVAVEMTFMKKNGVRFPVVVRAVPRFKDGAIVGGRGVITDVTRLKKVEKDLGLFSLAIEMSLDGIIIGDVAGNITYVNNALMKLYNSSDKNDFVGKHVLEFIVESDRARATQNSMRSIETGQGWFGQFTALTKNGFTFPVEVAVAPIKSENGVPIGFVDVIHDVSSRMRSEQSLKAAHRKLELMNEKLLVVGGLVRHDIANKLSLLNCHAFLAKKNGDLGDVLGAIEVACGQIKRILDFSKDYEMLGTEELSYVKVGRVFNDVVALFPDLSGIKTVNDCAGLTVLADSLLRELFYNLVDNTRKYGEKTTQIRLSYSCSDDCLKLFYEDDGVGISVDMKAKLFSKGFGKGTGLGLHLIKKTLEVYGWQIEETGIEGKGAKFEITIPKICQNRLAYRLSISS